MRANVSERGLERPLSFEDLFISESRRLFGALYLITGDPSEAEDIGQEAFVRVLERWDRVASMVDPAGYLYRTAINVFTSRYRRARVAAKRLLTGRQIDEIAEIDERDAVDRMLRGLEPRQRAALVLTVFLDYSSQEAGEILGLPGSSVRVLSTRARATLRQRAREDG
jgi:RNA polymerase sigma-70 factor, ECF subfamily